MEYYIRNMEENDIETIYRHIHKNYVSKYFKEEEKQWELHKRWYRQLIEAPNYIFYIFEDKDKKFIAMVSYEIKQEEARVGIYLNKNNRGQKLSKYLLKASLDKLKESFSELKVIKAYILEENIISKQLFLSSDFEEKNKEQDYLVYEKRINLDCKRNDE